MKHGGDVELKHDELPSSKALDSLETAVEPERVSKGNNGGNAEGNAYLQGAQLTILILILMMGQFIMGLDANVITTALPRISADFHSLDDVGWYGSAYLLATMATQPTWGKIYTYFDIKYTFFAAITIFEVGSIVCAVANSSGVLILGRAIAGVGQSALLAGGTIVIAYRVPLEKRPIYLAMLQSMNGVASVVGPPLGGVFTDSPRLTWRFCFWINVPFGAFLILAGFFYFKTPPRSGSKEPLKQKLLNLDLPGAFLFIVSMVCLFMALERGGSEYSWSSSRIWGWIIGFAFGLILFSILQNRLGDRASIPPRIISQRTVALSCVYTFLIAIGFSAHAYFLPFYFQVAQGATAEQSGLYLVPYLASIMVMSLVVGGLLMATGALSPFMLFGGVLFTVGSGLLTTLQTGSSTGLWIGLQILVGAGFGSTLQLAIVAIQATLPQDDVGIGNGLFFLSNFGGGSLGVGLTETIFLNVLEAQLAESVPAVVASAVISAGATSIASVVPEELVPTVQEAYDSAVTQAFFLPCGAAALGTLCVFGIRWVNLKKL